jgi:hypothetical protein
MRQDDDKLRCCFCGKSKNEVKILVAGPTVHICNECIDICVEIIVYHSRLNGRPLGLALPVLTPAEDILSRVEPSRAHEHEIHSGGEEMEFI